MFVCLCVYFLIRTFVGRLNKILNENYSKENTKITDFCEESCRCDDPLTLAFLYIQTKTELFFFYFERNLEFWQILLSPQMSQNATITLLCAGKIYPMECVSSYESLKQSIEKVEKKVKVPWKGLKYEILSNVSCGSVVVFDDHSLGYVFKERGRGNLHLTIKLVCSIRTSNHMNMNDTLSSFVF